MAGLNLGSFLNQNSLVFSSLEFLFAFLPVVVLLIYITPARFRRITLFFGSILLYASCDPKFVLFLLASTVLNYLVSLQMKSDITDPGFHRRWRQKKRGKWLALIVIVDIGLLVFFKAGNVFDAGILLPLGISFYTFKMVSYQIDVYRGNVDAEPSFLKFAGYVCLFTQVTSGPIMRYEDALPGLDNLGFHSEQFEEGLRLLILGLAAKVLLADKLGTVWNGLQTIGFDSISTPLAWLGAFAYSMQLYFDFEGYSLMAVGIGMMIGMPFIKNFDQPYAAVSVSDFWRRWHITLGSWFRDYVYIPLGGNRCGVFRTVLNLAVVWILTGLWHGSSINFPIWGLAVGLLVILEKLVWGGKLKKHKIVSHIYVLIVVPLTWVIFAIPDLGDLGIYFGRLFPFFGVGSQAVNPADILQYLGMYWYLLAAGLLFCIPAVSQLYEKVKKSWYVTAALAVLFWLCIYQVSNAAGNPFMYFQF